jgi:hypothetical protein
VTGFLDRFQAARAGENPIGLQLIYLDPPEFAAEGIQHFLHVHPELRDTVVEMVPFADLPPGSLRNQAGESQPSLLGLVRFGQHVIKWFHIDEPLPYGPIETCVVPALMPPEIKADARLHQSHTLLYYAGTHADPFERYIAVTAVAGAMARFGAIAVLNEEARTAAPALDLIPEDEEDFLATYRGLPLPYLFAGFVKLDVGNAGRPWARTYAAHQLGLPDLARSLASHAETASTFQLFTGVLGYLREMKETLAPGEVLDLGDGQRFLARSPTDQEWFLESPGPLLVLDIQPD